MRLYYADASFMGEDRDDRLGISISYAGDVNGDGLDDILLGAPFSNKAGADSGQAYLILGRKDGWKKNVPITTADASFIGEKAKDNAGISVSYAGDVNNDGYSDILIGAENNSDTGSKAGKCYLIYGKAKGWRMRTSLSLADSSILGEKKKDHFGISVSYAGDVNGDKYDDFLISASRSGEGKKGKKSGKTYLFWGKPSHYGKNMSAALADLILVGEKKNDLSGNDISYVGDINADGIADIIVGAESSKKAAHSAGQSYILFPKLNVPPKRIDKISLKKDDTYKADLKGEVKINSYVYIQVEGEDADPNSRNVARVLVKSKQGKPIKVALTETRKNSGIYRNRIKLVESRTSRFSRELKLEPGDILKIISKDDPKKHLLAGQQVSIIGFSVDDDKEGKSSGNGNGFLEAGETVELNLNLSNNFFKDTKIEAKITALDKYVKIIKDTSNFGQIASGKAKTTTDKFILSVSPDCPDRHKLELGFTLYDNKVPRWQDYLSIKIDKMVRVYGKIRDDYFNIGVAGAELTYAGRTETTAKDGSYTMHLKESPLKETVVISAPNYLKVETDVSSLKDQKLYVSLPPRLSVVRSVSSFVGEERHDASGASVAYAGDVNGDGFDDFLIGAWGSDEGGTDAGQTYLFLGKPHGWQKNIDIAKADASFIGENMYDESGRKISYAGDVNGDGFDDFLIGAPGNDHGGDKAGQVYLILGRASGWTTGVSLSEAAASFVGDATHDRVGSAMSYVGDVNGDGYDDIVIGAWANDVSGEDGGQVYLILGKSYGWKLYTKLKRSDASFVSEHPRDELGKAIAYAGDVNRDGYDDFLIGAPAYSSEKQFAGKAYLVFGHSGDWGWEAKIARKAVSFMGEATNDSAGSHLSYVGDINGDNFADFIIGAWANDKGGTNAGQVYLFFGRKVWKDEYQLAEASASFVGEKSGDAAGLSAGYTGDVNGDGYDDFLVGAWGSELTNENNQGQAYVIMGRDSGWAKNKSLAFSQLAYVGRKAGDAAGRALSYAGDVNGDGYDDFLIGAWGNDEGDKDAGETYLVWTGENTPPKKIESIEVSLYQNEDESRLDIQLVGEDGDPNRINVAKVLIDSTSEYVRPLCLKLTETMASSGVYTGTVYISSTSTNVWEHRILAYGDATITVSALDDASVSKEVKVYDLRAPYITRRYPMADEDRAPVNSAIWVNISDPGTGIDKSSIALKINDDPVYFDISGNKHEYKLKHSLSVFDFDQIVNVYVRAADLSNPPHMLEESYTFKTAKAGMVANPGFEEDFSGWKYTSSAGKLIGIDSIIGAVTTIDPTMAKTGVQSCKVRFTGERDFQYRHLSQGPIPVEPNSKYLLTGYVKTERLTGGQGVRLYVEGSEAPYVASNKKSYFNAQSSTLLGNNDWTLLSVPFSTKKDTHYIFIYLVRWPQGGLIEGTCWLDDLYVMTEREPGFSMKRVKGSLMEYFR